MTDRRTEAAATLARLGLDPEALLAGGVAEAPLVALIIGPEGLALATALGEFPGSPVAALLVALESHAPTKTVRREIRRALYRLKQRGVTTPARPAADAAPAPAYDDAAEGLVSQVDASGDRIIWIVRPLASGGSLLVAAQVNEPAGLRDVQAMEVSRKRLRAVRQRLVAEGGLRLVPAEWRTLDALLVEAHERGGAPDRQRDYLRIRPRLTSDPPRPPAELVSTRVARPTPEEAATLAATSAGLLEEPELRGWGPTPEAAAPFLEELAQVRESPIVLSRVAGEERMREILARAAVTLAPPAPLARRLEATAYVLAETGRPAPARQALAVAALLTTRPDEAPNVPFVAAFLERAMGSLVAADTARREDERRGALVVTPGEFLKDRASSRRGRTRG